MSSSSERPSERLSPPQSAQPYRSLFGGSSSQNVPNSESDFQTPGGQVLYTDESDDDIDDLQSYENYPVHDDVTSVPGDDDLSASPGRQLSSYHSSPERSSLPDAGRGGTPTSPQYRPNRFQGPDSTWKKLTRDERRITQALDDIRARDLSAHLYNAYALRVRAQQMAKKATESGREVSKSEAFAPPSTWTAWPLSLEDVPRMNDRLRAFDDDIWTLRAYPDQRDSAELEESIIASILKISKERFRARDWERPRPPRRRKLLEADSEDQMDEQCENMEIPQRPAVQTDDDISRRQLRPLTRNIITRFEQLLLNLHHARKGWTVRRDSSASERQSGAESVYSGSSSPRKRRLSEHSNRSQSRGRKRTRTSNREAESSNTRAESVQMLEPPAPQSRGRSRASKRGRSTKNSQRRPRDWSEVLAVASLTGWPSDVVMRATQRCSALFGEGIMFQKFNGGNILANLPDEKATPWKPVDSEPEEHSKSARPTASRSRSRKPQSRDTSTAPERSDSSRPPKGKGPHRKADLICPVKTCSRHANGFSRRWNLNQHMETMHPGYRPRDTDTQAQTPGVGNSTRGNN